MAQPIYIPRRLESVIKEAAQYFSVISVTGPRQSGKSTMLKHLFPELPRYSMKDLHVRAFTEQDPVAFLNQHKEGMFIDEVQKVPVLLDYIQGIVDDDPSRRFVLTGSSNLELLQGLTESLPGRAGVYELLPMSMEETAEQIADWITEHTNGKIVPSPGAMQFSPETIAVLINTIYLKDAWQHSFYEGATEPGTFHAPDGDMTVDYMQQTFSGSSIVKGDGYLRFSLYLSRVGRMTFVLPDEGVSLESLLGSPEKIHTLLHEGETMRADVHVKLPKFSFYDSMELSKILQSLGLATSFTDSADFSAMCNLPANISRVLQESYIGVDEDGVEAAAYTMVVAVDGCPMPEELPEIDFHLERPFLFAIEGRDGTVLFIGTVTEPTPAA